MKHTKVIEVNKNSYIPTTYGKFSLKKGDVIKIKVMKVKK